MRIISGKYRGKKLKEFDLQTTKPTLDRVKESMFNLIQYDVNGAVVCDLFSGTGALGLECLSRGAQRVYLVDNNLKAIKIIKENLKGMEGETVVVNANYMSFLNGLKEKIDIFFLDPPYKTDFGVVAVNEILSKNLLKDNGIIMFETSKENDFKFNYNDISVDERCYGTVKLYKITKSKINGN